MDLVRKNLYVAFQENAIRQIEKYADIIIKEDPYNEKILRDIMKQYSLNGYYNKALGIYYQLANILSTELDISPETSTTALFKEIVEIRSSDQPLTSPNPKFIGRTKELSCLMTGFEGLMKGQRKSFFISGEVGLGKTHLLQILSDSIKNYDCYILQSNCHETDKDFFLQPWDYIFKQVHQILIK